MMMETINRFGLSFENDEIFTIVVESSIPQTLYFMSQTIVRVLDLAFTLV